MAIWINQVGNLRDIGIVHLDLRAEISVISASNCLRQGHTWTYVRGKTIKHDHFLLHTAQSTYIFLYKHGLYVANMRETPAPRYENAPDSRPFVMQNAILLTSPTNEVLYGTLIPTTTNNEESISKRQLERSIMARQLQASLGFPSDRKLITALTKGSFLNCDILPEDVTRATQLWGPNIAAIQGKTNRVKPFPPPQNVPRRRTFEPQAMHCDLMFVNKVPVLVSLINPAGILQVACLSGVSTPVLRSAIRKMFGTLGQRNIDVVSFTSDNEKGIAALFGDMGAMAVEVIKQDPLAGHLVVFRNKNGGRLKVLYWGGDGLCLWYKRLEKGTFELPMSDADSVEISSSQLAMLIDGVSMSSPRRRRFVLGKVG